MMTFINETHGGLLKLGWLSNPNSTYCSENLELFLDNMLAYGSGYIPLPKASQQKIYDHQENRLTGFRKICEVIYTIENA